MIHGAESLEFPEMPAKPEKPATIEFYISPVDFAGDEPEVAAGEIDDFPNVALRGEEIRFDIAVQTGRPPEAVHLPYFDGLPPPIDAGAAYWAGQTAEAFAANRWNLPRHPDADPEPPILL
jgi:hypothetical protein